MGEYKNLSLSSSRMKKEPLSAGNLKTHKERGQEVLCSRCFLDFIIAGSVCLSCPNLPTEMSFVNYSGSKGP